MAPPSMSHHCRSRYREISPQEYAQSCRLVPQIFDRLEKPFFEGWQAIERHMICLLRRMIYMRRQMKGIGRQIICLPRQIKRDSKF
jgi:hypothetical protein